MSKFKTEYGTDNPIGIDNMTIEQLKIFARDIHCTGVDCDKCACNGHNFIDGGSCDENRTKVFNRLISQIENKPSVVKSTEKNHTCINCRYYDRSYADRWYRFCKAWHNFTDEKGFCYKFEANKNQSGTV